MINADMSYPVFRTIVSEPQASIPGTGIVYNVDYVLGQDGIIGVKTGSSSEAGGAFAFAAQTTVDGNNEIVYGDVLHQGGVKPLNTAFTSAESIIRSTDKSLKMLTIVHKGQVIGHITTKWNKQIDVVAGTGVTSVGVPGENVHYSVKAGNLKAPIHQGENVGTAIIKIGDATYKVPLLAAQTLETPSYKWRLERL